MVSMSFINLSETLQLVTNWCSFTGISNVRVLKSTLTSHFPLAKKFKEILQPTKIGVRTFAKTK